jgi:peptidoglycan/LPS O-acetylase OafA/YrhL
LKYRAEIDGLRALAVVPVILFHAGFELFRGGFVGVDVFFVISGYLITTILIEDIQNKSFSIVNFYERRARRILPALFFVMLVCIPFAWMWMLPSQMKDFSQSLAAVSLFVSNIHFLRESGYFDTAAEEKPLLHTWSLAVEEQYYVLFPMLLILAWRFGKNRVFWMIVVMASISLILSEWGWRNKATANFYLAPTRAWELFSGSIAAFIVQKQGVQKSNLLALLGLAAIIFSIFAYDETTPFPSVYALVPVLGVVLLVLYADKETLASKLLSTKAFVGIGLISYSAYLWHQPLFAFARIRVLENPSSALMLVLSTLTLILAYFSWKYIEVPFRNKKASLLSEKSLFVSSCAGLLVFMFIGLFGYLTNGIGSRMPAIIVEIDKASAPVKPSCLNEKFNNCLLGEGEGEDLEKFILVGDSHAGRYAYIFEKLAEKRNHNVRVISGRWCAPLIHWRVRGNEIAPNSKCFPSMEEELRALAESSVKTIVLAAEWGNYTQGYRYGSNIINYQYTGEESLESFSTKESFQRALIDTVSFLKSINKRVFIISPVPEYQFSVPTSLAKAKLHGLDVSSLNLPIDEYEKRNIEFFQSLDSEQFTNVEVLNVEKLLCNQSSCLPYDGNHMPFYSDGNHLSSVGLQKVGHYLYNEILTRE